MRIFTAEHIPDKFLEFQINVSRLGQLDSSVFTLNCVLSIGLEGWQVVAVCWGGCRLYDNMTDCDIPPAAVPAADIMVPVRWEQLIIK